MNLAEDLIELIKNDPNFLTTIYPPLNGQQLHIEIQFNDSSEMLVKNFNGVVLSDLNLKYFSIDPMTGQKTIFIESYREAYFKVRGEYPPKTRSSHRLEEIARKKSVS